MEMNRRGSRLSLPLKRVTAGLSAVIMAGSLFSGCSGRDEKELSGAKDQPSAQSGENKSAGKSASMAGKGAAAAPNGAPAAAVIDEQPSTVYYEVFVRSFYDSNGDGIGDLKGLTEKLDYLNDGNPDTTDDLGVGGIWLMPVNPSPSYHGYDITDYEGVNPDYGSLDDMRQLIAEAHKRGIKVIMDLVLNHTSTKHPWFISASKGKDSKYRDWYVWAEDQKLTPAGVSAVGSGNPWYALNGSHYLGTFWEGMPDLNYDNPEVRQEIERIGQYWLKLGVDGFRMDGAKHIYENLQSDRGEGATANNVAWWQEFRSSMNQVNDHAYFVGEVWENSAASIAPYLDNAFDSGFNFSLEDNIISAVKQEKDNNLAFTLERTNQFYGQKSQGKFTDAIFLSNHDQNRVMSQLDNNPDHAKMAAALLLTLPGNPFIYYGEEIGMQGVKPDERIREPFVWGGVGEVKGQTSWEDPLESSSQQAGGSVEAESGQGDSLLGAYRTLIRWRTELPALRDGDIQSADSGNPEVLSFVRRTAQESVLVMHNLSSKDQQIQMNVEQAAAYHNIARSTTTTAILRKNIVVISAYSTVILQ